MYDLFIPAENFVLLADFRDLGPSIGVTKSLNNASLFYKGTLLLINLNDFLVSPYKIDYNNLNDNK